MIKIQLTKSNPKIIMGVNPHCLMPIRVKFGTRFMRVKVVKRTLKMAFLKQQINPRTL